MVTGLRHLMCARDTKSEITGLGEKDLLFEKGL